MLVDRARKFLLSLLPLPLLLVLLLAACGGGGGNSGGNPAPDPGAGTGSLQVSINALPAGVNGAVRVTGPNNFAQDLAASRTLASLVPGSYTVAAANVTAGSATYTATPATQTVAIAAGATASATVAYSAGTFTLALTQVGNTFDSPTFVTAPSGDARLFVVERDGIIRVLQNGTAGTPLTVPWLDIRTRVFTGGEGGMLSMAFDPDFGRNGYFYVYYTDLQQNIVVERFGTSQLPNVADATSGLVILRIPHSQYTNHFGGLVAFGPDGLLYVGTGDGGGAGDPLGNAQNLAVMLGKLLRVDVRTANAGQPYTIPPGNPYLNQPGTRPEIWASGLRNPWRFAFDTSGLYIADVGQNEREEVNIAALAQAGANYGWDIMEGTRCYGSASCNRSGLVLPAFEYEHGANNANGCSITGGYIYRGSALPELVGRYLYSDYCGGYLKSFLATGGGASTVSEARDWNITGVGQVVSFGRDGAGELYIVSANGRIYRIVRGPSA
ncbi:PQQ-dependent sugar dehydrogenase [Massilia brevitalea]|uniref:PQQ-dependent sugar dehydrogenase n=1 Tax=Massilia brevitalea TaxID=442526 RepID=UPI00273A4D05|nr:PQQ-dependent sugar dehydrogenase [Massilia brevitalea]